MKKINKIVGVFGVAAFSAAVLVACGGGGSGYAPATKSVNATAALGAISGATCTAKEIGSTRSFGGGNVTNNDGKVTFSGLPSDVGALIVSCKGGSYFDEATGLPVTLSATDEIKTVVKKGATDVAVTPLTSLVAAQVEKALIGKPAGSSIGDSEIDAVAVQVAAVYAPGVNLLAPPMPVHSAADVNGITAGDNANRYAAALAGLSRLAANLGKSQLNLLSVLMSDLDDGTVGNDLGSVGIANVASLYTQLDDALKETVPAAAADSMSGDKRTADPTVAKPKVTSPGGTGASGSGT